MSHLNVKGGRVLTLNTVIRVNQIEAARNLNEGVDEAAIHTPETVAAYHCPANSVPLLPFYFCPESGSDALSGVRD